MLTRVKMVAMRPLSGDGYRADPGEEFVTDSRNAEKLEGKGLARRFVRPQKALIVPQNKMLLPVEENKFTRQSRR